MEQPVTYNIRRATPADAANIIALINAVTAEGIWLATDCYEPTAQWENVLHAPARASRALLLIAEMDSQIVGWCRVFPYSLGSKSRHVADIGIGVSKTVRRRGIGRALMRQAIALAKQMGYEKLMLDVYASNLAALGLFTESGFQTCGTLTRHAKLNGTYIDQIVMERAI